MGVGFFAGRTAWDPDANRIGRRTVRQDLRIHELTKTGKNFGIAKKAGDIDQKIAKEVLDFLWIAVQECNVIAEVFHVMNVHAAHDAPADRPAFVVDKIDFADIFQKAKDFFQQRIFAVKYIFRGF